MKKLSERYFRRSDRTFPKFLSVDLCVELYVSGFTKVNKPAWKRDVIALQPCAYEDSVRCTA